MEHPRGVTFVTFGRILRAKPAFLGPDSSNESIRLGRRTVMLGGMALACGPFAAAARTIAMPELAADLARLEAASGGRLGVAVLDCRSGILAGHRIDERFTLCSTFKLSLAAAILARIDTGRMAADAVLPIRKSDPVGHSPVLRAALAKGETGLSVLALAQAAQEQSDNGAANILLRQIGGPAGLTAFWRSLGDRTSRLDRYEPALNTSHDGDPLDTSTPAAMAGTMRAILVGDALKPASRERLIGWTIATQTGLARLRGGLPASWRAGDKTGTASGKDFGAKVNDGAIGWRPGRAQPFQIAAFFEAAVKGGDLRPEDDALLAQAARLAAAWMTARP